MYSYIPYMDAMGNLQKHHAFEGSEQMGQTRDDQFFACSTWLVATHVFLRKTQLGPLYTWRNDEI